MAGIDNLGLHEHVIPICLRADLEFGNVEAEIVEPAHARLELIAILATDDELSGDLLPEGVVPGAQTHARHQWIDALVETTSHLKIE